MTLTTSQLGAEIPSTYLFSVTQSGFICGKAMAADVQGGVEYVTLGDFHAMASYPRIVRAYSLLLCAHCIYLACSRLLFVFCSFWPHYGLWRSGHFPYPSSIPCVVLPHVFLSHLASCILHLAYTFLFWSRFCSTF